MTTKPRYARKPGDRLVPPLGYSIAQFHGYWYPLWFHAKQLTSIEQNGEVRRFKLKKSAITFCYQHKEANEKPYTCSTCGKALSFQEEFELNGLTYCNMCLPYYDKHQQF